MTIFNINKDADRQLLVLFAINCIKTKIIWQTNTEYCLDYIEYDDYKRAKELQIRLNKTMENVPIV